MYRHIYLHSSVLPGLRQCTADHDLILRRRRHSSRRPLLSLWNYKVRCSLARSRSYRCISPLMAKASAHWCIRLRTPTMARQLSDRIVVRKRAHTTFPATLDSRVRAPPGVHLCFHLLKCLPGQRAVALISSHNGPGHRCQIRARTR